MTIIEEHNKMMTGTRKTFSWLLLLSLLAASCQATTGTSTTPGELAAPVYLEEVIPPCTPLHGSTSDPCVPGSPGRVESRSTAADVDLLDFPPTISDILYGNILPESETFPGFMKHIVVRGTVQSGTTRCHDYYMKLANYVPERYRINEGIVQVHCFADVRVNDYLVGEGPPDLTVGLHREIISYEEDRDGMIEAFGGEDVWLENLLDNPAARTASVYEGKELVLFLRLPFAITIEAFVADGAFSVWFVQRNDDNPPRAVAQGMKWIRIPNRNLVNITLAELERQIVEAAANRTAVTGGRIGTDPTLPLLITDANHLGTYYGAVGAVYDGSEHSTVLPPPVPGAEDPPQPPANTGEGDTTTPTTDPEQTTTTIPTPGGEDSPGTPGENHPPPTPGQ